MDYLQEAARTKPDNVMIGLHVYGVHVELFDHRWIKQKTIPWVEIEASVINPITYAIDALAAS